MRHFAECVADLMGAPRTLLGFGDVAMRPDEVMLFSGRPDLLNYANGCLCFSRQSDARGFVGNGDGGKLHRHSDRQ